MTRRQREPEGLGPAILIVLGIVVVFVAVGWWWASSREAPAPPGTPAAVFDEAPVDLPASVEPLVLPELGMSDAFVRDLVAGLSAHPRLASWLIGDELVHRFVGVVVDLAGGLSPRSRVEFLVPEEEFPVRELGERLVMDPEGYRRYDLLSETFVSLDVRGTARLYLQLFPLFEEAYAELGIPDQSFNDAATLAIENLLAAEIPEGSLEVQPNEAIYEFRDLGVETRSPAEKHLIRMGSENAEAFQTKLMELRDTIAAERGEPVR